MTNVKPDNAQAADKLDMARLLMVSEVARLLHVHPNTVRRWSDQGLLPAYRMGRRRDRRFRWQDIQRFIDDSSSPGTEAA